MQRSPVNRKKRRQYAKICKSGKKNKKENWEKKVVKDRLKKKRMKNGFWPNLVYGMWL